MVMVPMTAKNWNSWEEVWMHRMTNIFDEAKIPEHGQVIMLVK